MVIMSSFFCPACNYRARTKYTYNKHIMTKKHKKAIIRHIPAVVQPTEEVVEHTECVKPLENSFVGTSTGAETTTVTMESSHVVEDKKHDVDADDEPLTPENSAKLYNWIVYQLVQQNQELKNTINEQNREFKETFLEQNQKYKDIIIEKNRIITDLVNKLEIIVSNSNLLGLIPKE